MINYFCQLLAGCCLLGESELLNSLLTWLGPIHHQNFHLVFEDDFNLGSTNDPADEAEPEAGMGKHLLFPVIFSWIVFRGILPGESFS